MTPSRILDRSIAGLFPVWGLRRQIARSQLQAVDSISSSGLSNRLNDDWRTGMMSADSEILDKLDTLVSRSRYVVKFYPWGRAVVNTYLRHVVGTGITPSASAVGKDGKLLDEFNRSVQRRFHHWAKSKVFCDVERRLNFWEIQRQTIKRVVTDGEFFIYRHMVPRSAKRPSRLILQRFEVDQLDKMKSLHKGNEVRNGIEIDSIGAPVAYHFLSQPDADVSIRSEQSGVRIVADRITHVYSQDRVWQSHGVPVLEPVLNKLRDLNEYDAAQLFAARMQACIGIIANNDEPSNTMGSLQDALSDDGKDDDGNEEQVFEPGMILHAGKGQKWEAFIPSQPQGVYDPYTKAQLRAIGTGTDLSYHLIARDFQSSYSAARQDMLENRQAMAPWQAMMIDSLCQDVWNDFVTFGILEGEFKAPGFFSDPHDWLNAIWMPPAMPWIDPKKEVDAVVKAMDNHLTTLRREVAKRGGHWMEILDEAEEEVRARKARGLETEAEKKANQGGNAKQSEPPPRRSSGSNGRFSTLVEGAA